MRTKEIIRDKNTQSVNDYMFRYLEKYYGRFRVKAYYDLKTHKFPKSDSFEDLYLPCGRSGAIIKHTYRDYDCLVICFYDKQPSVAKRICELIKKENPQVEISLESFGNNSFIYFYDKDIDTIAKVMKIKTSGSKIKWSSKRNLPKEK